ncbi:viral replicase p1 [Tulare apple mosaic virus]|uniref:Replication protein 1a n=1 Tax=Tulare apple mosaic virus TaxID=151043 RepID=Q99HR1_9BROM|nr:viral replicase p1 [Tulare apple mosaic virus]AAK01481.1 viral replicase p1 [Tulare apple mosaic virus]
MDSVVEHASSVLRLDDLLNDVVRRNAANAATDVGRLISDAAVNVVRRQVDLTPAKPLNVSFALTPEDQNALRRDFPGRELQFRNSASSSHAVMQLRTVLCRDRTIFIVRFSKPETTTIIDIGGNFCTHAKMGRENVHSCCPILDVRDGARFTDRFMSIAGALEKQPERELRLNYCDHKFEDCDVSAPWAMAIHSISDIPITTVVKHCFPRGVKKLIASVMMDPMMLIATEGFIPRLNVHWEIETIDKERIISFHFIDAPGLSYTHNYDVLMQYMTCNQVIVAGKAAYRVERVADLSGVFIVEITLASTNKDRLDLIPMRDVSCAWMSSLRRKTLVRIAIPQLKNSWEIKHVIMDTDFVRRVAEVSFRQYKSETPIENLVQSVATMISSASNHCVINGVTMQTGSPVPIDHYVPLAVTFVAYARSRYRMVKPAMEMVRQRGVSIIDPDANVDYVHDKGEVIATGNAVKTAIKGLLFPTRTKMNDNSTLIYSCPILESVVDEIKTVLGWDVWSTDDAVISSLPSFYKMEDVFEVTSEHYCLSHTLNVDYWLEGLYDSYDELRKVHKKKLMEEEARKTKVEKALLKIAEVLESDDCPSGLLPLKIEPLVASLIEKKTDEIVTKPHCSDVSKPHINPLCRNAFKGKPCFITHGNWEVVANGANLEEVWGGVPSGWAQGNRNYFRWCGGSGWIQGCVLGTIGPQVVSTGIGSVGIRSGGMDGDGFVSLAWKDGDLTPNTWAALSKYNVVLFDSTCVFDARSRLLPGLEKALTMDCKATVVIEDGVAGCGKTTSLLKQTKIETDLLLSANRETAKDARESGSIPDVMKYRVRTLDSYIMLKKWFTAERMLVDECFLVHSGIIYAAATLAQVKEIIAFGDTKQIPFVSRIPTFTLKHPSIKGVLKPKLVTYRCPRDATAVLSEKFYKKKVKTFNPISSSLSLININSGMEIPAERDTLYIMHTQADKCAMLRHPGINANNVMTTHEAQGKTFDNVILVRLSKTTNLLYSGKMPDAGPSHNLVALSRHRKTLRYYSVYADDPDDMVASGIRWSKTLDEQALSNYRVSG